MYCSGTECADLEEELSCKVYSWSALGNVLIGRVYVDLKMLKENDMIEGWFGLLDEQGVNKITGFLYLKLRWEYVFVEDWKQDELFQLTRNNLLKVNTPEQVGCFFNALLN